MPDIWALGLQVAVIIMARPHGLVLQLIDLGLVLLRNVVAELAFPS
jgi:hypothetical protein